MTRRSPIEDVVRDIVREEIATAAPPTGWVVVPFTSRQCRDLARRGELHLSCVGRRYFARALDLDAFMERHAVGLVKASSTDATNDEGNAEQIERDRLLMLGPKAKATK